MKTSPRQPPVVLTFSAHDPSGAAGVQADIESINANGAVCISVLTALTAQNTSRFATLLPQQPADFRAQASLLLEDIHISGFKIGLIGSAGLVDEIAAIISDYPGLPVVLDPVLHAGTGTSLATDTLIARLKQKLLASVSVLTPNLAEAQRLTGLTDKHAVAAALLDTGCANILITGADQATDRVINSLYRPGTAPLHFDWERLPGVYHGSGCTLAAAIAAKLAQGNDMVTAVTSAQQYCWQTLKQGRQLGKSQLHPYRN